MERALVNQEVQPDVLIDAAIAAEQDGDLEHAVHAWAEMRARFPDHARGYVSGGVVLKQLGRLPEAAAVLGEGVVLFPDDEWMAKEHAWAVQELNENAKAALLWRNVRRAFPMNTDGYVGGGLAARLSEAFDEADEIYRAGLKRLPGNQTLFVDLAWSAEERRDVPEAVRRWSEVRERFPEVVEGHMRSGMFLLEAGQIDEAEAVLAEAVARFPDNEEVLTEYAWVAHSRNDWLTALRRWEPLLTQFPHASLPRRLAAQALLELGRPIEASGVLAPALRMNPDDPDIYLLSGWLATRNREFKQAEQIWQGARERYPDLIDGYHGYALALRDENRFVEAEAMLALAHARFPEHSGVAIDLAEIPQLRQNWPLAIERWRAVTERFPDETAGFVGLATSLAGAKRDAEAALVYAEGVAKFPDDIELAAAQAGAAEKRLDWDAALRLWSAIEARHPDEPEGYLGRGKALRESGRLNEAAAHLTDALTKFTGLLDLEVELAFTFSAQRLWPKALALWESLRQRHPGSNNVRSCITYVLGQAIADQSAHGSVAFDIPAALLRLDESGARDTPSALLKRFESLGDSCEFGMVQRLYHVEQMSLLRWARTNPVNLLTALETRFAGVGDPEFTLFDIIENEYTTQDTRYYMHSHTFTSPAAEPLELFKPEQCRRMQWLKRKLIDNLTTASKIFVYKCEEGVTDADMLALHASLRRYSPANRLLCVRLEEPGHPSGSLHPVREGLWSGYIDKFSTVDISVNTWLILCQAAWDLIAAAGPATSAMSA